VVNSRVYVGSGKGLYVFKAQGCGQPTCSPLWTALGRGSIRSSPAVANGVVYLGSKDPDPNLYAFDASTGKLLWSAPKASAADSSDSSPTVAHPFVYIGSNEPYPYPNLYMFAEKCGQQTCKPLWTASTGGAIWSSPAVANGVVYVGSLDHKLYAFQLPGTGV
jgi:outer membrane protein assembly factor BamB